MKKRKAKQSSDFADLDVLEELTIEHMSKAIGGVTPHAEHQIASASALHSSNGVPTSELELGAIIAAGAAAIKGEITEIYNADNPKTEKIVSELNAVESVGKDLFAEGLKGAISDYDKEHGPAAMLELGAEIAGDTAVIINEISGIENAHAPGTEILLSVLDPIENLGKEIFADALHDAVSSFDKQHGAATMVELGAELAGGAAAIIQDINGIDDASSPITKEIVSVLTPIEALGKEILTDALHADKPDYEPSQQNSQNS